METGAAGLKLARCALLLALLAVGAVKGFMPRPSKATTAANCAPGHHMQPLPTAPTMPLAGRSRRPATPTSRLGSTPMVEDVETDGSAPSDTSEDVIETAATAEVTTPAAGAPAGGVGSGVVGGSVKDELMELIAGGLLDFATPSKRAAVNELLLKLEALNPTEAPAFSPLLNGAWEFLYTGGISPGILGALLAVRCKWISNALQCFGFFGGCEINASTICSHIT